MSTNKTIELIKSNDLFKDLDFDSLDTQFDTKNFLEFKEGDLIYASGQPAEFLYLLVNGEVKLKLNSIKRLFFKSPNEYFGESEVLEKGPRSSSALANSDCLIYQMDENLFNKLTGSSLSAVRNLQVEENKAPNEKPITHTTPELIKKIADVELKMETTKVDLKNFVDFNPKFDTTIDLDKIEIPHYQQEPDLDAFIQQKYLEHDNKSLKSNLIDDPDDMTNWVITEGFIENVSNKKTQSSVSEKAEVESTNGSSTNPLKNSEMESSINSSSSEVSSRPQSSSDINKTAKDVLEYLLQNTDSKDGAILLFSQESQMLEEVYQTNESIYKRKISTKEGITGIVAKEKEIRFAVSFLNDINYNQDVDRPNNFVGESLIIIPFVDDNNTLIGIAQIGSKETMFTKEEERKIKEYADYGSKILYQSLMLGSKTSTSNKQELSQISNFIMQDVKAPLLTIKHYSSILSRFDLPEEVRKVISLLSSQASSVIDLLQSSIDFSEKNTKTKLEVVSFNEVMDNNLTLLSDYVESRNVKLFKKLTEDVKIKIDKRKFYVACYYIARFACDLMKQGGNLYFSSQIEDTKVVLNIKDGNKIASEDLLENVFNPGFTNNTSQNVGLSLAIAKFIIESLNGSITLQNEEPGTSYLVSIPISS